MTTPWTLPTSAVFGGKTYDIHCDFRDVLEIFSYFNNPDYPQYLRWEIAMALFYAQPIPSEYYDQALSFLADFISGGNAKPQRAQPKVLDWDKDADLIIADINRVSGREIRSMAFLHWWTFLSWFHAIGEGQLSTVVAIRHKLARGKKLEGWELDFYRENKKRIDLPLRRSREDEKHRRELEQMLKQ